MVYPMMKSPRDWMPAERHKRSQNAGVVYTLVDEVLATLDALMRISSWIEIKVNSEARPPVFSTMRQCEGRRLDGKGQRRTIPGRMNIPIDSRSAAQAGEVGESLQF